MFTDTEQGRLAFIEQKQLLVRRLAASVLHRYSGNRCLDAADDIAQMFWAKVLATDFELLKRYDPNLSGVKTYLYQQIRSLVGNYLKSAKRRKIRENSVRQPEFELDFDYSTQVLELNESLSKSEQKYLIANLANDEACYTDFNRWQLRHRIKRKV